MIWLASIGVVLIVGALLLRWYSQRIAAALELSAEKSTQSVVEVDETYVKVAGICVFLCRAVDSAGETITRALQIPSHQK